MAAAAKAAPAEGPKKKNPAPRKKKATKHKEASKSVWFSQEEIDLRMDCVQECLPIGKILWESVEAKHNTQFPNRQRKVDNFQRQFNKHTGKKAPTGNRGIPPSQGFAEAHP